MVNYSQLRRLYRQGPGGNRAAYGAWLHSNPEYLDKVKEIEYPVRKKRKPVARLSNKAAELEVLPKNSYSFDSMGGAGQYSGKLVRKKGKSSMAVRNKYQKAGAVVIVETYGKVTDNSLIGVGHITWSFTGIQKAITAAILRKLFNKAGIKPESSGQKLELFTSVTDTDGGFVITWRKMDANGTLTDASYSIPFVNPNAPTGVSIDTIVSNCLLTVDITNMMTEANSNQVERVFLFEFFGTNSENPYNSGRRLVSTINLKQEILELSVAVTTVIQNRTASAGVPASNSTDIVDSQPLKGPLYTFRGCPKTKTSGVHQLNTTDVRGVVLFRYQGLSPEVENREWAEPPSRNSFSNVINSSYVRLSPGQLKDMSLSKTWKGAFKDLLYKFRMIFEGAGGTPIRYDMAYCPGDSQIAYLEEELNSGSSNSITVQYETQHTVGCVLRSMKTPNMGSLFVEENISLPQPPP